MNQPTDYRQRSQEYRENLERLRPTARLASWLLYLAFALIWLVVGVLLFWEAGA